MTEHKNAADRRFLDEAVRDMLAEGSGKLVDIIKISTTDPAFPHALLYPLTSAEIYGDQADPQGDVCFVYQVTNVGETHRQCADMSDLTRRIMTHRGPNGAFLYPLVVEGCAVQNREVSLLGAIVTSGDNLFECADTYRVKAGV
jgi:hypothetical protein